MQAAVLPKGFLDRLLAAIDANDSDAFVNFLTEDARFRFGSAPAVTGRDAIRQAVDDFFASIDGCSHSVSNIWYGENSMVCEGEVCYRKLDGSEVILPFVDVFDVCDELVSNYKIYIDPSPLFSS
jgi:hypothetical protein